MVLIAGSGTYSHAKGAPNCDKEKMSKGNMCAEERQTYGERNGFYWFTGDVGEPTVQGHTVFVATDCTNGYRLGIDYQPDERYKKAIRHGAYISDDDYKGWVKVWKNRELYNRFFGGHYGPKDDPGLKCFALESEPDKRIRDADVIHCMYRIGELLKEPAKLLPIKKNGELLWDRDYYRGCSVYVHYTVDWDKSCEVSQAEVASAAQFITFNCMKEVWAKGHTRFGVKGVHSLRSEPSCRSEVVVYGGLGSNINIGLEESVLDTMDPMVRSVMSNLPEYHDNGVEMGDPVDPSQPCGPLGCGNGTQLQD